MTGDDPQPKSADSGQARRGARAAVHARARFRQTGSNPYEVELRDLSQSGFRMFTYTRPAIGSHIWVTLPGLQAMEAIARRGAGNDYGCEFVNPLHPSVAEHLQKKLSDRHRSNV